MTHARLPTPAARAARRGAQLAVAACGRTGGFTLVEVLVALLIMAIIATMGWQGIDGMVRARDASQAASERALRLSTVVAQWDQDMSQVQDVFVVPALNFDGATLRLTRHADGGLQVVAWSLRGGNWQRWSGPVVTRLGDLQESWLRSQQLLGGEEGQLTLLQGVAGWQLYYFRDNAWTNAQSSAGTQQSQVATPSPGQPLPGSAGAPAVSTLPAGVRLLIDLGERRLTRDVVLPPQRS